ncbi:MAG: serine/threonine-protein kinase [Kofleriaceae bacterium]
MFLAPGSTLDRYEILSPLAVGGMAELYLARATGPSGFERLCVVKRILAQHASDPDFVRMFLDEARLAATLRHPNVIQVHDVGVVRGRYYFAMEYVHGQDLAAIVAAARAQRRGLRVGHALTIVVGAAAGLHHAHEQVGPDGQPLQIVHRDVSPSNLLVSYEGHVKVVDFGIAKAAARATKTTAGGFKGKLSYMSPEQVAARRDLDRRSDVFSLGVVLYELTTGRPLFRGDSDYQVATQILNGQFPRPREVRPTYDADLEQIVMTALAPEAADRFPTAQAMQVAIEALARAQQVELSSHSLAAYMRELFADKLEAWQAAQTRGVSLAEHVRASTLLDAAPEDATLPTGARPLVDFTPAVPPAAVEPTPAPPAPARRRWGGAIVGVVGGAAVAVAATLALARSSSGAAAVAPAPDAAPLAPTISEVGPTPAPDAAPAAPPDVQVVATPDAAPATTTSRPPPRTRPRNTPPVTVPPTVTPPAADGSAAGSARVPPRSIDDTLNPYEVAP